MNEPAYIYAKAWDTLMANRDDPYLREAFASRFYLVSADSDGLYDDENPRSEAVRAAVIGAILADIDPETEAPTKEEALVAEQAYYEIGRYFVMDMLQCAQNPNW